MTTFLVVLAALIAVGAVVGRRRTSRWVDCLREIEPHAADQVDRARNERDIRRR